MKKQILSLMTCSLVGLSISSCVYPDARVVSTSRVGLSVLPYGYRTIHVGGYPYYYAGNTWYRRSNGRYITTSRPSAYRGSIGRNYSSGGHAQRSISGHAQRSTSGNVRSSTPRTYSSSHVNTRRSHSYTRRSHGVSHYRSSARGALSRKRSY